MPFAPRIAVKVPSLVLIVLVADFATAGAVCAAGEATAGAEVAAVGAAGAGAATGALAVGAAAGALAADAVAAGAAVVAGAAAGGFTESVTPLPCDQAPLDGSAMSTDINKM